MGAKDAAVKKRITWLIPPVFLIAGVVFYVCVSGCSFLGIVFCGIAAICIVDNLLSIWKDRKAFRIAKNAWNILVISITVAAIVTVIPILQGPTEVKSRSDFCIVLGAGVKGTEPSEILQDRIDQAYVYLTKNPDVICIATGGKGNDENISEAQCIYDRLTAMGIDGNRIWMEDQATSTIENFQYSLALIQEKTGTEPRRVTVLSNEFHLFRASIMAEDCGLAADFVAAPTSSGLIRISYTLREIFALWKYLTIGG